MQTWRLIESGEAESAINMAVDEAIALACREGRSPTTLRFYTWRPVALSIGYFQDAEREIDLRQCRIRGYGFVRRPTGGKAVLHDRELTYSVSSKTDSPLFPQNLQGTFMAVAKALISGLNQIGIQAQVFGHHSPSVRTQRSPACFATPMGFEIGIEGKKLIGSAQRRWKEGFLQHGSVLLDFDPNRLIELLKFPDDLKKQKALSQITRSVTSLSDIYQKEPEMNRVQESLISGFENTFKIQLIPSGLTPSEEEMAHTLYQKKYATDSWNLHRSRESS